MDAGLRRHPLRSKETLGLRESAICDKVGVSLADWEISSVWGNLAPEQWELFPLWMKCASAICQIPCVGRRSNSSALTTEVSQVKRKDMCSRWTACFLSGPQSCSKRYGGGDLGDYCIGGLILGPYLACSVCLAEGGLRADLDRRCLEWQQ